MVNLRAHAVRHLLEKYGDVLAARLERKATAKDLDDLGTESLPDLDGDGVPETNLTEGYSWGTAAAMNLLYLSGAGCPHLAGEFVAGSIVPLASKRGGVRDLEATTSDGCAGRNFGWARYRWNGTAYQVTEKLRCEFCAELPPTKPNPPGCSALRSRFPD